MALQNEEYVTTLVYDYLLEKDTALASTFQEKFSAKPLPKELPSMIEVVSYYQKKNKCQKHAALSKVSATTASSVPVSSFQIPPANKIIGPDFELLPKKTLQKILEMHLPPSFSDEVQSVPRGPTNVSNFPKIPKKKSEVNQPRNVTAGQQKIASNVVSLTKKESSSDSSSDSDEDVVSLDTKAPVITSSSEESSSSDEDVVSLTKRERSISKPSTNGSNPPQLPQTNSKKPSFSDSSLDSDDSSDDSDDVKSVPKAPKNVSLLKIPGKKSEANQPRNVTSGQKKIAPKKGSSTRSSAPVNQANSTSAKDILKQFDAEPILEKSDSSSSSEESSSDDSDGARSAKRAKLSSKIATKLSNSSKYVNLAGDSLNSAIKSQNKPTNYRKKK